MGGEPLGVKRLTPARRACRAASVSLSVLYEDNHLLVVDKPAGLLAQAARVGDDTLVDRAKAWLKARYGKPGNVYVGLVHRLDRSTSGVVVLAKTSKAAARLSDQFRAHDAVTKDYLAVVHGRLDRATRLEHRLVELGDGSALAPPHAPADAGKRAVLHVSPLAVGSAEPACSLVAVRLETGRKHQIRVQLAAVGHPLVGDRRYGREPSVTRERVDRLIDRVALHAWRIALQHPTRTEPGASELAFEAPIPDDFRRLCERLGLGPLPLGENSGGKSSR